MGTFGALMGSLIAGLAYNLSGRNYAVTFSLSALPALGALFLVTTVSTTTSTCFPLGAVRVFQPGSGGGGDGVGGLSVQGRGGTGCEGCRCGGGGEQMGWQGSKGEGCMGRQNECRWSLLQSVVSVGTKLGPGNQNQIQIAWRQGQGMAQRECGMGFCFHIEARHYSIQHVFYVGTSYHMHGPLTWVPPALVNLRSAY